MGERVGEARVHPCPGQVRTSREKVVQRIASTANGVIECAGERIGRGGGRHDGEGARADRSWCAATRARKGYTVPGSGNERP
jgi:hypothetical protein